MPFALRFFGLKVIDHEFEMFGTGKGKHIRMAASVMQAADVPGA